KAEAHRRGVHPDLRGRSEEAGEHPLPGARDRLSRRHRERPRRRGDDQEPSQRGRPSRRHGTGAHRAAAGAFQGRGAGGGRSAGTAGPHRLAAAVPGAGPCGPGHRRSHGGAARDRAAGGRHRRGGDRAGGPGPGRVAVLRRADGHPRGGRLPGDTHVRVRGGGAGSDQCRRDDRRLGAPALRRLGAHLRAHHAGGARGEPGGLRHQRQAAGHHRVGVKGVKYTVVQPPRGAKDILPREAYVKSRLEQRAAAYLESWGYARVYTPTFEFFDAIAQGDGPVLADSLYRFVDRDGAALALRPDMTIPIARMVATRYQPEDMPLRLYYVGNVFRYAEPQAGRYREFTQVGVELIGAAGPRADAEVVAVAAGVLESLGLASFRLDLGHVGYL